MKVYREPERGEHILFFADPAEGRDFCAMVSCSKKHADTPVTFNQRMESSQFGYELEKMAKYVYNRTRVWPTIAVERNVGAATTHVLQLLNYPDLFRMVTLGMSYNKQTERVGWDTTKTSRPKMLDELSLALRQRKFIIYDREVISQMMHFIKNPRTGKPEAEVGRKDDLVISAAGVWQIYQIVPLKTEYEGQDEYEDPDKWRFK